MAHRRILLSALVLLGLAVLLGACAERKSPSDSSIRAHPETWMDPQSADFHGALVKRDSPATCASCHGLDLKGDGPAPSCDKCHAGPSGHPEGYAAPPSPFHPETVAAEGNGSCASCHGANYRGGWAQDWAEDPDRASCYTCHGMGPSGHPSGWLTPSSPSFHGAEIAAEGNGRCAACHGDHYRGGTSGVSCYNACHDGPGGHPDGWVRPGNANFHGTEVREQGGDRCTACHGADYMGGSSGVSCYNGCHDGPGGHPAGWISRPAPFHGDEVAQSGTAPCLDCHTDSGANWTGYACSDCH